jgi:hypothetical protein
MRAKMEGRDMPNQNYALPYAKGHMQKVSFRYQDW